MTRWQRVRKFLWELLNKSYLEPNPDVWAETTFLPRGKYVVVERWDGWAIYTQDAHGIGYS